VLKYYETCSVLDIEFELFDNLVTFGSAAVDGKKISQVFTFHLSLHGQCFGTTIARGYVQLSGFGGGGIYQIFLLPTTILAWCDFFVGE
jgi:hypothetical protein